ncbi:MAG TPA: hypothetical protein VK601_16705 [Kofleriaceae bacterium]|nr:hypothetical protein [Kofleriaceae bacterium]
MRHAKIDITFALAAFALALALGTGTAHAQPSGAQAETLFRQGKDLMAKGKIAEACAAFDASQKLDPTIATLLNQAACREKNDQLATAWGLFLEAERQTRAASDAATQQLHQVAAGKAAKLESRLSTLTITVPAESRVGGLQILRGSEPVDAGAWNKALPVDGGSYKITASAPGNAAWSSTIAIATEHDAKTIEIPKLKAAALGPARVSTGPGAPAPAPAEPRSRLIPLVVGGAAVALAAGALGFELSARSTNSDIAAEKTNNDRRISLWHSANTKRFVAEGLGIASVACAGVAVWLYLRSSGEQQPSQATARAGRVHVAPLVASDGAGLLVFGRY